jgi:hypothetical protein
MEGLTEDPDNIHVDLTLSGNTCNMNYNNENSNGSVRIVDGATNYDIRLKAYIEHKNTPTSMMDQYDHGIKKDGSLNTYNKIPISVYGYNGDMINSLRQRAPGIYKNMSISSIIESLTQSAAYSLEMDDIRNNTKYDQVLIPNLNVKQTIQYFEDNFSLFAKGALLYGEGDKLYIVDTDVDNGTTPIPIYVESYKNSSDMTGLKKNSSTYPKYIFNTKAQNVSVITESDIEKVLNSLVIADVNVNTWNLNYAELIKVFGGSEEDSVKRTDLKKNINKLLQISTPDTLHKSKSESISQVNAARITERVTRVDLSGVGFDVFRITPRSRFNLIFESPIRGMSINQRYRASSIVHTFSNQSSDFFIAQTTMHLCSN